MANVTDIINYYVNLLIIQYHNQPKAQATIALFAKELLASGILLDIQNGYNVNSPSAVGTQLDIVGKYVGVDRFYSELILTDYFSFTDYIESLPASPPRFGFSDYADFGDYDFNGMLTYGDIIESGNRLFDGDFLTLIKLKIVSNNSNFSHKQIDDAMFRFFGTGIRPESSGNMTMVYFVSAASTPLIQAILSKNLFPKPMAVGLAVVSDITGSMFSFADYSGYESPYGAGYSDYADYATLPGQFLIYDQITEG